METKLPNITDIILNGIPLVREKEDIKKDRKKQTQPHRDKQYREGKNKSAEFDK